MNKGNEEKTIILAAQAGDRQAFATLLKTYYSLIYRMAYKWCGNQSEAEDIAQDVVVKLATSLSSYDNRAAFSSWLYKITLNRVRDFMRARSRHAVKHDAYGAETVTSQAPEQEQALLNADVWDEVRNLPDKQRDCVLLVYGEELSHLEAAQILDMKESTVSWNLHEARKCLKERL